jgi:hypothetical protein
MASRTGPVSRRGVRDFRGGSTWPKGRLALPPELPTSLAMRARIDYLDLSAADLDLWPAGWRLLPDLCFRRRLGQTELAASAGHAVRLLGYVGPGICAEARMKGQAAKGCVWTASTAGVPCAERPAVGFQWGAMTGLITIQAPAGQRP